MNSIKSIFIILFLASTFLLTLGYINKAFAPPPSGFSRPQSRFTPPIIMPRPRPNIFIEYKWSTKDVVKIFNIAGLGINNSEPLNHLDYYYLPTYANQAIKFTLPSLKKEWAGNIFSFNIKSSMERIKKYYLKKNSKGELYSWTFEKDNILVVLNGLIVEEKARMFEHALNQLN